MKRIAPILFLLLAKGLLMQAQVDLQNTGILYVSSGTDIVYINGALTNTSAATLTNNGSLYVRRNITNNQAGMATGTGTLLLTGSIQQTVGGTQSFKTFNLNTNNAAGVLLNSNLHVNGVHTFVTGIITSSATPNYLVYEAGSSHTGSSDNRHVNGWVKKLGNTNFSFPVGTGTYERAVAIENLSAVSEFNAHHRMPTISSVSILSPLMQVDPTEYWEVNRISGGTARVHLNWDESKVDFPGFAVYETRVAYLTGGYWTDQGGTATGSRATTGDVTSNVVNAFGAFTFGSNGLILPLTFLSITAERKQGSTLVQWKTAQEQNVDHFQVERSANGNSFTAIGTRPATNSNRVSEYEYTDALPLLSTIYYRIRSIDRDGKEMLSKIVAVTESNNNRQSLQVVNNPAQHNIYVAASAVHKGNYRYTLYNATGQLIQSGQLAVDAGIVTIPLTVAVVTGVYTFDLYNQSNRLTKKLIIQQ